MRFPSKFPFILFGTIIFLGFGIFIVSLMKETSVTDELVLPQDMSQPSLPDSNEIFDRSDTTDEEDERHETVEPSNEEFDEVISWLESLEDTELERNKGIEGKAQVIHETQQPIDPIDKVAEKSMGMTAEQIEAKIKMLYEEIPQKLEERLELQKIVSELAPDYGDNPELDAIRDMADEDARKLMFTIADMIGEYVHLSRDDTPFIPGGEFYDLLQATDLHIDIKIYSTEP